MATLSPMEYEASVEKIAKINARAAKRGFTGRYDLVVSGPREVSSLDALGFTTTRTVYDVELTGEPPSYNGYTLLATLDWDSEAGLIVRAAPGVETIDRSGLREGWCEHCKTARRRTLTYLVGGPDGSQVQVGSTCIKDFLGWTGQLVFLSLNEASVEDDLNWRGAGGYAQASIATETVLAMAWAAIKAFGYQPASGWGQTTKGVVTDMLAGRPTPEVAAAVMPYVASSVEQAKAVRAFVLSEAFSGASDYVTNLKAIAAADYTTIRNIGFLASAPQAYARYQDETLVREQEAAQPSEHVGAVKERLRDLRLTVKGVRFLESGWGTTTLLTLTDDAGNVFKWFASGTREYDLQDVLTLTGTVREHDEYRGIKQTVLTRCVVTGQEVADDARS